jgi:hypothetical protein
MKNKNITLEEIESIKKQSGDYIVEIIKKLERDMGLLSSGGGYVCLRRRRIQ